VTVADTSIKRPAFTTASGLQGDDMTTNLDARTSSSEPEHVLYEHPAAVMINTEKRGPSNTMDAWARCIRDLLERKDIKKSQYGHVVSEILGMQYMAGYRRVVGKHPWRVDEIEKIANHFGETLIQVLGPLFANLAEPAVILIGSLNIKCRVILGENSRPPFQQPFVAIGGHDTWVIMPSSEVTRDAREVREIIIQFSTTPT
jgi:hypothetical protein